MASCDETWMHEALKEGCKAAEISAPNPAVGCVLVREKSFPAVTPKSPGATTPKLKPSKRQEKPDFPCAGPRRM